MNTLLAIFVVVVALMAAAYRSGKKSERADAAEEVIEGARDAKKIDNDVAAMSHDARINELCDWSDGE